MYEGRGNLIHKVLLTFNLILSKAVDKWVLGYSQIFWHFYVKHIAHWTQLLMMCSES